MLVGTGNGTFAWSGPNGFTSTAAEPNGRHGRYLQPDRYRRERLHQHGFCCESSRTMKFPVPPHKVEC